MSFRISITGIDGTGKTTIVRRLRETYAATPNEIFAFRAPQYHEDANLPFHRLSAEIDAMSESADRAGDVGTKCAALLLSMTLYGDVERHALGAYAPRFLVAERQCVLDSLAYASFYLPRLALNPVNPSASPFAQASDAMMAWLSVVDARAPELGLAKDFAGGLGRLFSGSFPEVVGRLQRVFHCELPNAILILTVSPETLKARLALKKAGSTPTEAHEQANVLSRLASKMQVVAASLKVLHPNLHVETMCMDGLSVEKSVEAVLTKARAIEAEFTARSKASRFPHPKRASVRSLSAKSRPRHSPKPEGHTLAQ